MVLINSIKNIEQLNKILKEKKNNTIVLKIYTPWCSKCKELESKLKETKLNCEFYKIDIDSSPFIDDPMFDSVSSLPCLWIYKNNNKKILSGNDINNLMDQLRKI